MADTMRFHVQDFRTDELTIVEATSLREAAQSYFRAHYPDEAALARWPDPGPDDDAMTIRSWDGLLIADVWAECPAPVQS